jgi:hypothetical protein
MPKEAAKAKVLEWLRNACSEYKLEPIAIFRRTGEHGWPLVAADESDLERKLSEGKHFLPLPKEPAALANVLEVAIVDFMMRRIADTEGLTGVRGRERTYPDIEMTGSAFGDVQYAVDVKVARRAPGGRRTQSRITLYTGNTYFKYPTLHWPGTFRPFADYEAHYVIVALYTLNENSFARVDDLELVAQETWRIASTKISSTTREYLGAVEVIADIKAGKGEFDTREAFYKYWRKHPFRIGRAVQKQLEKLLANAGKPQPNTQASPKARTRGA